MSHSENIQKQIEALQKEANYINELEAKTTALEKELENTNVEKVNLQLEVERLQDKIDKIKEVLKTPIGE